MIYYLNELSVLSPCTESKVQAIELMQQFITVCRKAKKIGYDSLRYEIKLKGICLSTNYFVQSWLRDDEVEREIKDSFRGITANSPFFDDDDTETLHHWKNCVYDYNGKDTYGLGFAHLKETLAVSFITSDEWNRANIELEQLLLEDYVINTIQVLHASLPEHIDSIKKTFEFHKEKHGICGKNAERNQSIMYCCTAEEAEILLNTGLPHPNRAKWICNYDSRNKRFVVFPPHAEEQGKYHGFHYENTPNADPDRDLNNPQNGIPKRMQEKLQQRMILYNSKKKT